MAAILLLYSTVDGHTLHICRHIQAQLQAQGHSATLASITAEPLPDLAAFDAITIAASIRYGKHRRSVFEFVARHLDVLERVPSAFFSVNLVARKPEKNQAETNPYVRKFFAQTAWRPQLTDVFAGKIDYPRYRLADKLIIRFIMWMTNGPTDLRTTAEFTDWQRVDAFAKRLGSL
ncbi:menaquinone-dependent protoporphyrinogen IX dehydrogenase [Allofranklinella schreckenbergeri]|uniref:Protoporphyrinogen IX dehydrogenase [quinone] n=1 Tax=Allofranklinella schreckenbergeri TaxID=1076744 RepID=A0A3M6R6L8_9BURK|nr:menaquinone-dependent protoporphyrinogen IX dehydrogenase [Allofranklinella schreckenbergeri]RMX00375.1 menaquinone-dependent protoporphyrinogen IX dehydrogenase [Allofranklinella schreckenbergeri]RMX00806.1 menaquinone-dependent protoporphyrinogen IX dehydrogenase [Allofranklinella schreckenbergeri]RMX10923.1 menaquinone-dependent protoporphyrinogen IX dehydrogenase [Allofranklinella schreckenbergeri]RRD43385.1 menaquinone-dependent protoporphyrinogen IX dehydrogenase [Comamonadaceae bacter